MSREKLLRHREIWAYKASCRYVYREDFFSRIRAEMFNGCLLSLEVGAGPGFFKEYCNSVLASDVTPVAWLDLCCNAMRLPFQMESLDNVICLDVLHHLSCPLKFLEEVERVLVTGGRLIMVEPWITAFSLLVYKFLHQEGCDLKDDPFNKSGSEPITSNQKPFDGNSAIPYIIFQRHRKDLLHLLPNMLIKKIECFSFMSYLFSLGFKRPNILPLAVARRLLAVERKTRRFWAPLFALRALVVMEKLPQ